MYSIADVVVIGGGFGNFGGQNLIQPLAQGKPVLHGPHMQNFREVSAEADRVSAAKCCNTPKELAMSIIGLLIHPTAKDTACEQAKKLVAANLGASKRYAQAIADEVRAFHAENAK